MPGKRSPHIIFILISALGKFLKLGKYQIIASGSLREGPHIVMHFLTSVNTQHHIAHLTVAEFHHFVIQGNSIGCQGETEILVVDLLLFSSVTHQIFDNLPVHQRLTAEEIHLQIPPGTGIRDQKIQRLFSHFVGHQFPVAVVLPSSAKQYRQARLQSWAMWRHSAFTTVS